jgi:hypothetical protein
MKFKRWTIEIHEKWHCITIGYYWNIQWGEWGQYIFPIKYKILLVASQQPVSLALMAEGRATPPQINRRDLCIN